MSIDEISKCRSKTGYAKEKKALIEEYKIIERQISYNVMLTFRGGFPEDAERTNELRIRQSDIMNRLLTICII